MVNIINYVCTGLEDLIISYKLDLKKFRLGVMLIGVAPKDITMLGGLTWEWFCGKRSLSDATSRGGVFRWNALMRYVLIVL